MDDSRELFEELVQLLLSDAPQYLQRIRAGVSNGDADAVRHGAHALKGMVCIFAAGRTMQAAAALEQHPAQPGLMDRVAELEESWAELGDAIRSYQWQHDAHQPPDTAHR